ncbi:hypothetical protein BCR37DRAFT_348824 [Protomyces lactucae-debilis]|uniref:Diphthine--ammonia ligase n=1 Tax=Protomyces lactucae-debilis TaxID=2754530 RepID=A0A1Y2FAM6_PROLT|nr:uncharacterized protein BCR37DRAFT_348824 [Protomyces lactucae-debilis]ORY80396.1 hypothetical protein BCR37DRAFT_348824 [Protomyces lactucae-debilis]
MKVVALISGGKDSCYNMMHCVANDHEIVALANLHPALNDPDEMDSWMYQTVGHDVVPMYAEAMGLPMFRQVIHGTNVATDLHYTKSEGDETEDLMLLLSKVKDAHPDVTAVSVGAIASNYQRLRVEHVASRLGLTVLAYMWEQNQTKLLQSMCDSGLVAILIKVAAVGLSSKHLGKTLSEMQPTLMRLHSLYEVHPCGEGGEYETIVLDCPLFIKRLEVVSSAVVELDADTAHLQLKVALQPSESQHMRQSVWLESLYPQQGLDEEGIELLDKLQSSSSKEAAIPIDSRVQQSIDNDMKTYGHIRSKRIAIYDDSPSLAELLPGQNDEVLFCLLILRNMGDFATINTQYAQLFQHVHPPSRVCIATGFTKDPKAKALLYTLSIDKTDVGEDVPAQQDRRLWVQSRSYWAPSNIGPYSQLTQSSDIAFISGQIGLIPSSMEMPDTLEQEICWSIHSLYRIMVSQKVEDWYGVVVGYVLDMSRAGKVTQAFQSRFRREDIQLLIVELQPGSQMPRGAEIEWQTLLCKRQGDVRLRPGLAPKSQMAMSFSTADLEQSQDLYWDLRVSRIILDAQAIPAASVVFGTR